MKSDEISKDDRSTATASGLPDDFARRVIVAARAERRRRARIRLGGAVGIAVLAAIPLISSLRTQLANRASEARSDESSIVARHGWPQQSADAAMAYQLARQDAPHAVGDYLLPGAGTLTEFASSYSDASWRYDPYWTYYR